MKVAGVRYEINWARFKRGTSMFFPCLDTVAATKEVTTVTKRLRIKIVIKIVIVEGIRGLRVWRV